MAGEAHRAVERAMIVRFLRRLSKLGRKRGSDKWDIFISDTLDEAAAQIENGAHIERHNRRQRRAGELLRTTKVKMGPVKHEAV